MTPDVCPICGADIPKQARACPQCGSCEETGWSEDAEADGLDSPDDEFNYEEYVQREFGEESPKPRHIAWIWWVVAILILAILLGLWIR